MEGVRNFLGRVLPWPSPEEDGYLSIHTSDHWKGVAVRNVDEFMKELSYAQDRDTDVYFCLAQQGEAKANGSMKLEPIRKGLNAKLFKAIWVDWDAGPDKAYKTSKDAAIALNKFLADTGLPKPSAIVASGSGGFHVYFFSDRPLIKGVWEQYARGLKALLEKHGIQTDVGCTTDAVRILRVPGTKNFKHSPPKPVWQVGELGPDYDFSVALADLALNAAGPAPRKGLVPFPSGGLPIPARFAGRKDVIEVADAQLPPGFPPMSAKHLRECLDRIPNDKVSWDRWNTTGMRIFAACDGEDYGREEWQRWSNKLKLKVETDSCEDRWNTYHTSPPTRTGAGALINEVRRLTGNERWLPTIPKAQLAKPDDPDDWMLPYGYRLKDNRIERHVEPKKKKGDDDGDDEDDVEDPWHPFIKNEIIGKPWAQKGPDGLMMTIRIDVATVREVFIASTDCPRTKIIQKMCELGIWFDTYTQAMHYEGFFMNWIGKMNSMVAANEKAKFGWEWGDPESKLPTAFVYGGDRYKNDGTKEPVGATDKQMREDYYPQGKREVWDEAAKVIFDQKRPGLELIVAATLAGPLVQFTRVEGCMLSVYSTSSGAHKSTASKLGAAIFGHPVNSRQTKGSSHKGALKRAGDLQHLTIPFDDLQDDKDLHTASLVALQLAQGHEGDKLDQKRDYAAKGTWQTMALTLSNQSIIEFIIRKEPNTSAPLNRIFEVYHTKQANDDPGMIDEGLATRLIGELNRNFGHVGRQYAELLANNVKEIDALVEKEQNEFRATIVEQGIEGDSANRYWIFTCTVLLTAAKIGPLLGIPFDYDGIRKLLVQSFIDNSSKRSAEGVEGENAQNAETALSDYLNETCPTYALWSINAAQRGGNEDKIKLLGTPPREQKEIHVHLVTSLRVIRIARKPFKAALKEDHRNIDTVVRGLVKHFGASVDRKYMLGAGSDYLRNQERVVEIPVPEGSPWEGILFAHGGKADEQL